MLERLEVILKVACAALAAVLVFQLAVIVARSRPVARLAIPALPVLAADTNAPAAAATNLASGSKVAEKGGTNSTSTNALARAATNLVVTGPLTGSQTNVSPSGGASLGKTNSSAVAEAPPARTNTAVAEAVAISTNQAEAKSSGTNLTNVVAAQKSGSNTVANLNASKGGTNSGPPGPMGRGGFPPGMRPDLAKKDADLPPPIKARIDRITQSEILGPVMRPLPMALLGIAGSDVFLRAPNGQTGLIKEGAELGGVKLLRVGTNRVLVEQDGQKKELMIFDGFGSETLMPKEKDQEKEKPNEPTNKKSP